MSVRLYEPIDREAVIRKIETAGRLCYGSENAPDIKGAADFVRGLVEKGHESVIEHVSLSVTIECTRACSHQLVRHRMASYSQMSQRYTRDGLLGGAGNYVPPSFDGISTPDGDDLLGKYLDLYSECQAVYELALSLGVKPQLARYALPNGTMTRIFMTANLRQWRHMIRLRTSPAADDEIRELFSEIRDMFRAELPEIFGEGE